VYGDADTDLGTTAKGEHKGESMFLSDQPRFFAWTDFETTGLSEQDRPIELAIIMTDEQLNEVDRFQSLIRMNHPDQFMGSLVGQTPVWLPKAQEAAKVHKIKASEILDAPLARFVGIDLIKFLAQYGGNTGRKKPILVSDNPRFEDQMLNALVVESGVKVKHSLYYNMWSPIMLTTALGLGRPKKNHRAMGDVEGMLGHVRKAAKILDEAGLGAKPIPVPDLTPNKPAPAPRKAAPRKAVKKSS